MSAIANRKGYTIKEKTKSVANDDFNFSENDVVPGR